MASIPNDVISEIFSWLPAKSLTKFSTVSNTCLQLVSDPWFIKKQALNSLLRPEDGFLIQPASHPMYPDRVEFHPLPGKKTSTGLPQESVEFLMKNRRVLGSSNGLVLCRDANSQGAIKLLLCNPVTKASLPIELPTEGITTSYQNRPLNVVLGCDDYNKLVSHSHSMYLLIYDDDTNLGLNLWPERSRYKTYSFESGKWVHKGDIDTGERNLLLDRPVSCNGNVYILSDWTSAFTKASPFHEPYLVHWNVQLGTSTILKFPEVVLKEIESCNKVDIFRWGSDIATQSSTLCLVILQGSIFTIWVLENVADPSSWIRLRNVYAQVQGIKRSNPHIAGFTVLGQHLIFATTTRVYRCGLVGRDRGRYELVCRHECGSRVCFDAYSCTLQPCSDF